MGVVYTGSCVYMAKLGMILTECTQRKQTHRIEEIIMENKTDFEPESTYGRHTVVPELLRTLVFARPCGGDQFAAGTVSPSLDMSR